MKNYNYECVREFLANDEIGNYTSYGIVHKASNTHISDVSTDKSLVSHIVELLNEHQISPTHMSDVIEDLIVK